MQQQDNDISTDSSSSEPDYSAVDLPDKPRTEWHYTHRRAELLQLVREAGHPDDLNQTELAERYGVTQQQISKDLRRLGDSIRERLTDPDRRLLTVEATVNRSIRGLLDEGEYRKAAQTALEYDEWIHERIEAAEFRERLDRIEKIAESGGDLGG
jgi:hypothetical protein